MLKPIFATFIFLFYSAVAHAATADQVDRLIKAIGLPDMVDVMRTEGLEYGAKLGDEMFEGRNSQDWAAVVSSIYDADWMASNARRSIVDTLKNSNIEPLLGYFDSTIGQQIIGLEISARKALMDESIEDASKQTVERMVDDGDPRIRLIDRFVNSNDLLENNVVSALNSNYAFFIGLADGGAFGGTLTEDQILRDVWEQEDSIRTDTKDWLYSFLAMAYQPLDDETLTDYIALGETPAGQDLNKALFIAFDEMFEQISKSLGSSAALFMSGEDL